jgi:hypothetical protein
MPPFPAGVKAYTLAYTAGSSSVTATEVSSITANQPVLVNAAAGDYTFTATGNVSTKTTSSYGALTGVYTSVTAPMDSYVLQDQPDGLAFYRVATSDIAVGAYRAYLTASASAGAKLSIIYGVMPRALTLFRWTMVPPTLMHQSTIWPDSVWARATRCGDHQW